MPAALVTSLAVIALTTHLRHSFLLAQLPISVTLLVLALAAQRVARTLHFRFLHRSAAGLSRCEDARDRHVQGVPRWVEQLANVAFGLDLAAVIPLIGLHVP